MKVNLNEHDKKKERNIISNQLSPKPIHSNNFIREKGLNELTHQEIDNLTIDDLDYLREKYQIEHPKTTIIGNKPYNSFLEGIEDENWMSTGDQVKDE
ncbi:MAG: hypothetical protein ACFFAN_16870 [Promethearchaeota archaeon]